MRNAEFRAGFNWKFGYPYERHTKIWSGQMGPPVLYRFIQFLVYQAYRMKRNNGTNGKVIIDRLFRLFRYFRLFRHLSSDLKATKSVSTSGI
jgi:hypothetical protein